MSPITRFLLCLCAALLTCMFWSQDLPITPRWWAIMTPAQNEVKKVTTPSEPKNTSTASERNQESPQTLKWEAEQKRRKAVLRQACRQWSPKAKQYLPKGRNDMLFWLVDDLHKAIYCYVPKVSCTTWKRIWMILTGMTTKKNPLDIDGPWTHLMHHKMMLVNQPQSASVLQSKLDTYTKFLAVRDPFERLLSAYRNKLEHGIRKNTTHWRQQISEIKDYNKKYGTDANTDVTFSEFVNYVNGIPKADLDEHWRTYHQLCYPCAVKYDVIAKYETLAEDSERFLQLIGAPADLHYPHYVPSDTKSLLSQYMANLSLNQRHSLYQVYQRDFEAFEYQPFGGVH